jgi:Kef-type K+ transport system membrane component KefB
LLLILTGIIISLGLKKYGVENLDMMSALELLGIIGLIMIVLEAALDLELSKDKLPIILKEMLIAFFCLLGSSFGIALIFQYTLSFDFVPALLYGVPLSSMSSAIIIPSVSNLLPEKKEFMIYESAFSDILGIMTFSLISDKKKEKKILEDVKEENPRP